MPISKIKSNAINDGAITIAKTNNLFVNTEISGTEAVRAPVGTTAQRANPKVGDLRHNTDNGYLEQYTADGWASIAASPVVSSISPTAIPDTDSSFDITINGSNFSSGATVQAIGQDGSTINATSTARTSGSVLVSTFDGTQFADAQENYSIKVSNNTGLAFTYADSLAVNASPAWTTAASPTVLATVYNGEALSSVSVAATDDEGATLTYSLSSGSFPTGVSVNSNGAITGTPSGGTYAGGGETFTPTLAVSDGTNSATRTFNILRKWNDGTSSSLAAADAATIYDFGVNTYTNGTPEQHWIQTPSGPKNIYCKFYGDGWGWMLSHTFGGTNSVTTNDNYVLVKAGFWMTTEQIGNLPSSYSLSGTMSTQLDTKIRFSDNSNNYVTSSVDSSFWAMEGTANTYNSGYGSNQNYLHWWAHSADLGRMHLYGNLTGVYPSTVTHAQIKAEINASNAGWSGSYDYQGNLVEEYNSDQVYNTSTARIPLGTLSSTGSHMYRRDGSGSTEKEFEWWVGNQ